MLIPESGAGYSRVTHPFATDPEEQALLSPFDLHVLSTPPAFILSQDQTLHKCLCAVRVTRNGMTVNDKFETDKNKSILTCFVLFISISKGIRCSSVRHPNGISTKTAHGFLAFDIVHAVEFSRIGRSWFSPCGFYPGPS